MTTPTLRQLIQAKLASGDSVVAVHEVSQMKEWVRTSRYLALLEHPASNSYALFVFVSSAIPPIAASELSFERIVPLGPDFKCNIESEQDQSDVYLHISKQKLKLLFEMVPGEPTSSFVGEIFRCMELVSKGRGPPPDASWTSKYEVKCVEDPELDKNLVELRNETLRVLKTRSCYLSALELESGELVVPRQSIAKGTTPIAARESVIRYQMSMKEDDYTHIQNFKIFVGTWNVNGQPPTIGLREWLCVDAEPPDIYAVGFQELDLRKEAFLFNDTPREGEWLAAVSKALHPGAKYRKVQLVRLVGMMLIVFVKESLVPHIKLVAAETVGTGIAGRMGNKGGVAMRFELHNTSLCFVNSHLAAHVEEFERRNQDYHDICQRLTFGQLLPRKSIKDHDQVYWLGDLNYRITEMDPQLAKHLIASERYLPVFEMDQLKLQHEKKNVFVGYQEGEINFKPTYKYDPGTDEWDSSEKNRAPAWCDRVLWKGEGIKQLVYRSHPELRISDHKPVSSLFESEIRVIDIVKYRKIHEDVMKKLDKLENEFLPQVMVDNTEIILDTVRYLEPQKKELIIANTGQVPVQFEFIKKLDDRSFCKEWLNIEPYLGFIMPGDKCDILLEVFVDKKSACKLNSGEDKLYDILVLHLEGGKDIFITVTGTYERSCFGMSIEALVYMPLPIREVPIKKLMDLEAQAGNDPPKDQTPLPVPKEVWFLVDHLYKLGLEQQHLFEHPGLHTELIQIRNWLDEGSTDPIPGSVHSVAEALLLLLESTAEPVVPFSLHAKCLDASSNYAQSKEIVNQLPVHRKNVFLYLCSFLQELLNYSNRNGLDAKTLATLFGGVFLREPPRTSNMQRQQAADRKKASFVYNFLVNSHTDFIDSH
ncbi:type II inositol 1,4,5-trisphosphate 5-phosphatase isoform X3 [Neocloeon triangulifer]|uniref:type II inositol 1,4,5-trisphosphate 5-phosphatase isoform X3 n=1 Tax=Neocloeon triangulifer TaxID=2078957 RepID=UPI00286F0CD2|nr:type II inositol 1,4,5-trisphosphate 5-phosphatase isoform X3 [Neocloeon triangulifer]